MTRLTATQRMLGLVICAFVFVFGVYVGFFVLRDVFGLSCDLLVANKVISANATATAVPVLQLITFNPLCWANWRLCRKLWPYLFTQHYNQTFRRTDPSHEDYK